MAAGPAKKKAAASPPKKGGPARSAPTREDAGPALPLKGKKVAIPRAQPPAQPVNGPKVADAPAPLPVPTTEANGHEKPLCWIELVKNGNVFVARSSTTGGTSKEYKNRVLEDMLTELIIELQEDIQE